MCLDQGYEGLHASFLVQTANKNWPIPDRQQKVMPERT
jgi:hypothetical protein